MDDSNPFSLLNLMKYILHYYSSLSRHYVFEDLHELSGTDIGSFE